MAPVAPADYESVAFYPAAAAAAAAQAQPNLPPAPIVAQNLRDHSLEEMNLNVLRRYVPTIQSYIAMAHNATLFTWNLSSETGGWEETGVKGPFFVCIQEQRISPTGHLVPRACVFLLNRSSPENAVFDLATIAQCELTEVQQPMGEVSKGQPLGELLKGKLLSAVTDSGEGLGFFIDLEKAQETWDAFSTMWHSVRVAGQG